MFIEKRHLIESTGCQGKSLMISILLLLGTICVIAMMAMLPADRIIAVLGSSLVFLRNMGTIGGSFFLTLAALVSLVDPQIFELIEI